MFLDHNNFVESNELFDNDEAESDEKDQNTQLFSYNMFKIKEKPINIFEVVKDQIDLHLNIKADIKEIKEVVKKEITENKTIYVDENIDSYVAIHEILTDINDNENLNFDKIILAIASSFYTNVVLFDSATDYSVITGRNVKCNAPIFIQKVEHIDRKFNSLQYKDEVLRWYL